MQAESLSIKLVADIADLQRKMQEAQRSVTGAMANIGKAADSVKGTLAGLGVALSVGAFATFIKGAIDAADEMSKLAQKTGVAVESLAGLQLAYQQAGLTTGDLQSSLSKLAVAAAANSDALKAMGIASRNADGSMKSTREILGLVADRFANYRDGVEKTALAVQLFGKSGADMIPLLNAGAESLDEFDQTAKALGLTISGETAASAEKFNDTLDLMLQGTKGIGAQLAAQLLPTLQATAEAFLRAANNGNLIPAMGKAITVVFQTVAVIGANVAFVIYQLLNGIVSLSKAAWELVKFNYTNAQDIMAQYNRDAAQSRAELDAFETAIMGTGSAAVESMTAVVASTKQAAPVVSDLADKAAKAREQFELLRAKITGRETGLDADFGKNLQVLKQGLDVAYISLEQYVQLVETYITRQKFYQDKLKAEAELIKQFEQDGEKLAEQREKDFEQRLKQIQSVADLVEQVDFEAQALQMTNVERETAIKLRELERLGVDKTSESYTVLAERIRQAVIDKEAVEASIQQQKEYARQWERITDQIGQSLTNSLIEGGKSAADYLKSLFRTLVLRPLLEPIIRSGVATVMGAMGLGTAGSAAAGTAAGTAGGGMQTVSTLSTLNSVYKALSNGLSSVGALAGAGISAIGNMAGSATLSATGAGMGMTTAQAAAAAEAYSAAGMSNVASSLTTGAQLGAAANLLGGALVGFMAGKMISGGYSAIGKSGNTAVAVGTAIGAFVGGPIGAAIGGAVGGLFNRAFGRKLTQQGITGTFGGDGGFSGMNYTFEKGGWFRSDRTSYSAMDAELQAGMGMGFLALRQQIIAMGTALGQGADAVLAFRRSITVNFMGMSNSQAQAALEQISREMSDAMAILIMGGDQFVQAGESATDALSRLYSRITAVNGVLGAINQRLYEMTLVGADLASTLADAFGGLDKFNQATAYYYENFFTDAERAANTTEQLRVALANMGYALPSTRDEFRAIVSGLDLATDAGRNMFVALMNLAPAFASITKSTDQLRTEAVENLRAAMGAGAYATGFEARRAQLLVAANAGNLGALGIAGFASGGLHDGGLRMVGEAGPELEVTGPARYYSAAETAALMGGGAEVAAELRYLREENRAQSRAIIGLQNRMTKLLEQWDGDGLPATREVA